MADTKKKARNQALARFFSWPKAISWMVLLIGLLIGVRWLLPGLMSNPNEKPGRSSAPSVTDCNIQTGPCTRELAGRKIILDIHPKPVRAMRDLRFTIQLEALQPTGDPHIDLDMPAMTMGFNRVYLESAGPGLYEGDGVIVRCPTGIPTWQATVVLPGLGEVDYTFDVIY